MYLCYCSVSLFTEAVPKRILELMNVPGLTRENVASHLQVSSLGILTFQRQEDFWNIYCFNAKYIIDCRNLDYI